MKTTNVKNSNTPNSTIVDALKNSSLRNVSEETTPPTISEDVVSLTNNSGLGNTLNVNNSNVGPAPIAMMGGRLYRILSYKKKKSNSKRTRKHK